ncbi:MAG: NHL repeat-containing protein [Ignavibacteriae bacterium]|nr:NHL repeat-containing protein [Ignavibacteriota bacterium]
MIFLLILNFLFPARDTLVEKKCEYAGFKNAVSVTTDGKGNIYVLDNESNEIIKLDGSLNEIKRTGKKGWNNGEFDSPTSMDGSSGLDIYVTDGNNYRIQRFDLNLSYVSSLVTNLSTFEEKLKFNTPVASVVLNLSALYVIDGENKRIVSYPDGITPGYSFGGFQSARKPFLNPVKLLKDGFNRLYVFDKKGNALHIYDNFGNFVNTIESSIIKSVSIYNNIIYIFTGSEIILYSVNKNAYTGKISLQEEFSGSNVTDMQVYSENKILFLEKNKISFYIIN